MPRDDALIPRCRRAQVSGDYEATVTPLIADRSSIPLSGSLAADVAEAEAAITRFDERTGANLAGFSVIALRTEAAMSSQIENLTAAASSIAVAEHAPPSNGPHKSNAELIASNVATLLAALSRNSPLDTVEVIELQRILLEDSAWTGVGGGAHPPPPPGPVAPHHERVPAAMTDLVAFANRTDLGALAHIAVTHAHFETVHPFPDGNGRTGRVLIQRMLRSAGLTRRSNVPLSAGLLTESTRYFDALNRYRDGDVEPIIGTFVDATFHSLNNADQLVDYLFAALLRWTDRVVARCDSAVWPLLEYCIGHPAITIKAAVTALGVSEVAVSNAIDRLVSLGILHQNSPARRNRIWLVSDVLDAVEDFMDRARRR
ncbi:MAG: Fic family protein [Candidatus Microthrix sp.]|uniref:Fic family protein n=2 Tax=Candidatus Neomicrothrix sp. TaxID=2719034 RepID=UPI0025BA1C12|nr:Fic family protein [Candidatus Microthrix sp.]MBL0204362.1 Fic family protein [Candidatus Microthrix sp.]